MRSLFTAQRFPNARSSFFSPSIFSSWRGKGVRRTMCVLYCPQNDKIKKPMWKMHCASRKCDKLRPMHSWYFNTTCWRFEIYLKQDTAKWSALCQAHNSTRLWLQCAKQIFGFCNLCQFTNEIAYLLDIKWKSLLINLSIIWFICLYWWRNLYLFGYCCCFCCFESLFCLSQANCNSRFKFNAHFFFINSGSFKPIYCAHTKNLALKWRAQVRYDKVYIISMNSRIHIDTLIQPVDSCKAKI